MRNIFCHGGRDGYATVSLHVRTHGAGNLSTNCNWLAIAANLARNQTGFSFQFTIVKLVAFLYLRNEIHRLAIPCMRFGLGWVGAGNGTILILAKVEFFSSGLDGWLRYADGPIRRYIRFMAHLGQRARGQPMTGPKVLEPT